MQAKKGKKVVMKIEKVTFAKGKKKKNSFIDYLIVSLDGNGAYPKSSKLTKLFSKTTKFRKPLQLVSKSNVMKIAYSAVSKKNPGFSISYSIK